MSVMDGKIKQPSCNKFYVKLGKSATETFERLREAIGEHSLSQILRLWALSIVLALSRTLSCLLF
jgi:hypothetical protein